MRTVVHCAETGVYSALMLRQVIGTCSERVTINQSINQSYESDDTTCNSHHKLTTLISAISSETSAKIQSRLQSGSGNSSRITCERQNEVAE